MSRCKAVLAWMSISLILFAAGCAALNKDADPIGYEIPGEYDDESSGFFGGSINRAVSSAKSTFGMGPSEEVARRYYQDALARYQSAAQAEGKDRQERFLDAADEFGKAASRWPASSVEEDALFHRAECYFFADRYPKANDVIGQLLNEYPSTKYLDKASQRRFQLAKYWLDHHQIDRDLPITPNITSRARPVFDKFGHAIRVLDRIRLDDPTGELADDATMLAASASFTDGRYYRADEFLSDLRRSFPSSKHQFDAHLLALRCKMELYQGPNYDGGPLDAAEELIKQMRRQFPQESREHDEFLAKSWKDVRMNRAIREMNLARYRDRRKEFRAARARYGKVARDYSDTSLADEASARLAQLRGEPDLPPQRLKWLANVFPTESEELPALAVKPDSVRR